MNEIFNYFSGNIDTKDFLVTATANPQIAKWFQNLVPAGAEIIDTPFIPFQEEGGKFVYQRATSSHPFWKQVLFSTFFNEMGNKVDFERFFKTTNAGCEAGSRLNLYYFLFTLAKTKYIDLVETDRYRKEYEFYLDACVERYESKETMHYIDDIILKIYYSGGTLTARKRAAKKSLKEAFHIEGSNYPYWIHGSLWPMGENSPMKYISTKKMGEKKVYLFQDVDTGERRTLEDFY